MSISRLACLALLATLCACKLKPTPEPTPNEPPPTSDPAMSFDGTYRGTSTRYQADNRQCPSPGLVTFHVLDASFDYRWNNRVSVPIQIASDLSLTQPGGAAGPASDIVVSGHAGSGLIEGDVTNPACALHFTARRRG